MTRAPRNPKRSPTPTSATFPPNDSSNGSGPPSPVSPNKPLYLCSPFVEAALVKGNFKTIVMLPKYVDIMEWVAVNSPSFSWSWIPPSDHVFQSTTFTPTWTSSMVSLPSAALNSHVLQCRLVQRVFQSFCIRNLTHSPIDWIILGLIKIVNVSISLPPHI